MVQTVLSGLRAEEIRIEREETVELLCRRHGFQREVAERIVASARTIDQAHALAELMR